jgi:excinuclease ABC subunit C
MDDASSAERFEQAAQLRDAIRTIETFQTRQQKMASVAMGDRDAFGIKSGPAGAVVQIFQIRRGRVVERMELVTENVQDALPESEVTPALTESEILQAALQQFYADRPAPPEVHMPVAFPESETEMLEGWLGAAAGRRVRILVPRRGEKRGLLDLAARNAAVGYQARFNENVAANYDALETLRTVLALPSLPRRIECFDISTIQGSETVASMVVCEDGRMKKGEYRKFRIRGSNPKSQIPSPQSVSSVNDLRPHLQDDCAAMREVVQRRYRKIMEDGGPFPDLILIDGGKGQLSAAYEALESIGLGNLVSVGLAKKEELLVLRDRDEPVALLTNEPALLLLQRIRDEAHRFAVTFHRKARSMRDLRSELDTVPGIGPRRRRALLTAFGSLAGVRRATREELDAVVGPKTATAVIDYFARSA